MSFMKGRIFRQSRGGYFAAVFALSLGALAAGSGLVLAQQNTLGPFSAAQATTGQRAYLESCAGCHGNTLSGANDSPALAGPGFMQSWGGRSTKALYQFMSTSMPVSDPGSLSPGTYADILAFLLEANGAKAGTATLSANTDVRISAIANGQVPAGIQKGLAPLA